MMRMMEQFLKVEAPVVEVWHSLKFVSNVMYSGTPLQRRPRYNEQHLKAQQNFSKIYGNKPHYNEPRYNEIPAVTN